MAVVVKTHQNIYALWNNWTRYKIKRQKKEEI